MSKTLFAALAFGLMPLQALANAQGACAPREQIVGQLTTKYGERQVVLGLAANGHVMELFASPAHDWTLVATRPNGMSCIVVTGAHLSFVPVASVSKPADPA